MFRFTIRDLLWATVVVALGVAWWVDRRRLDARHAETKAELQRIVDGQQAMVLRYIKAWNEARSLGGGAPDPSAFRKNLPSE
jgi:hypothetical protein